MVTAAPPQLADLPGDGRHTGRVWWFCPDRGFGWLRDGSGQAWFVTYHDLPGQGFRCLDADTAVSFVPGRDRHGAVARAIVVEEQAVRLAG